LYGFVSGDNLTQDQLKHKIQSMYISTAVIAGEYFYTDTNAGVPDKARRDHSNAQRDALVGWSPFHKERHG
jgi:hypothetical protein